MRVGYLMVILSVFIHVHGRCQIPPPPPFDSISGQPGKAYYGTPDSSSFQGSLRFEEMKWQIFLRNTTVKPQNDAYFSFFTANLAVSTHSSEKYGFRAHYENPLAGDIIALLIRVIRTGDATWYSSSSGMEHMHSSALLGWLQVNNNVIVKRHLIISPGISFGDHVFRMERRVNGVNGDSIVKYDPAGVWPAIGPSLMVTTNIIPGCRIDLYSNFDFAFSGTKSKEHGYPKPKFLTLGCTITHKSGFFIGFRNSSLVDTGRYHGHMFRMDSSIGYTFTEWHLF